MKIDLGSSSEMHPYSFHFYQFAEYCQILFSCPNAATSDSIEVARGASVTF